MCDKESSALFDEQARRFDSRAGLSADVCEKIAESVLELAAPPDLAAILDVGAGTGVIGFELSNKGYEYIAMDASGAMLEQFRARYGNAAPPALVQSDARTTWPVASNTVGLVFGSRSLHWIEPSHLVGESRRVASEHGCALIVGRVVRSKDDPRRVLRHELHRRLQAAGYRPRRPESHGKLVVECAARAGADVLPCVTAATIERTVVLGDTLAQWRSRPALAGTEDVPGEVRKRVLDDLTHWAFRELGNVDTPERVEEAYALFGVRWPAR